MHRKRAAPPDVHGAVVGWIILAAFGLIIGSLVAAGVFLIRDKGKNRSVVHALTLRIGMSVALFLLILVAWKMGWIEAHGIVVDSY